MRLDEELTKRANELSVGEGGRVLERLAGVVDMARRIGEHVDDPHYRRDKARRLVEGALALVGALAELDAPADEEEEAFDARAGRRRAWADAVLGEAVALLEEGELTSPAGGLHGCRTCAVGREDRVTEKGR